MIGAGEWLACPPASSPADKAAAACTAVQRQADKAIPDQLFMVAPSVAPQIGAPLGWVLVNQPASSPSTTHSTAKPATSAPSRAETSLGISARWSRESAA